ncbi:hypothetical protein DTL42_19900 [Bremerella cremea]|uniref:Type 4a pilus biogenesis protein PilO n=1 Tax=Bremerella cremea TaxID=1031537 RepID=A0A368KNT7_9BACT|nr:type 4a pilus biogenesis protein PilO [Bremerella cremea]RCS42095.1 hypothetical protein DTL42_19900 [Bremerella cremea]
MKWSLPKTSTPFVLLGLAFVVAFVLLVYFPLQRVIKTAQNELATLQATLHQEDTLLAQIEAHRAESREIDNVIAAWPQVANPNLHLSQMLGKISREARQVGADALRLEPGQSQAMQAVHRIPVQLGCRGTFQEIHQLICQIDTLPYQLWIERVELAPADDQKHELTCEMDFTAFIVPVKDSH